MKPFIEPVEILLIEDNLGDVDLTREALRTGKVRNTLHVVRDGEAAMAFLRREGKYADAPRPGLVLLDLNLPKKDGREVLAEMKSDKDLKSIPVAILTSSSADEDILKSYNLHANCFITKPIELNQFIKVVQAIEDFWLAIVELPPNGAKK
jgi:CheY-like chemotaxis protein